MYLRDLYNNFLYHDLVLTDASTGKKVITQHFINNTIESHIIICSSLLLGSHCFLSLLFSSPSPLPLPLLSIILGLLCGDDV